MRKELEGCKLPRIGESDAILPKEGVPISNAAERRTDNESSLVAKPVPAAAPTVIKPAEPMATQLNVTPAIIPVTSVPAQSREETAPLLAEPSKEREAISLGSLPPSEPDNSLFSDFMREIDSKFAS